MPTSPDVTPGRGRSGRRRASTTTLRTEIQALRALAVMLVVAFHLWPLRLHGGYVGVDVFFVISGYLITAHLIREVNRSGSVNLAAFWARRARRLLPAAFLVLTAVVVATVLLLPDTSWRQFSAEVAASTVYVENWLLAHNSVDYLASEYAASPVQHFWSLSTEEQFYLVWPVLIVAAIAVSRVVRRIRPIVAISIVLGLVTSASFVISVIWTRTSPPEAYFVTPTRAWEFGAGGLLATASAVANGVAPRLRAVVSWCGVGIIGVSAVLFTERTAFPGWIAAVPVMGALAVIWAGDPAPRWSPTRVGELAPVQWLGGVSYSVYLWHWPLIVIVPLVMGRPLTTIQKIFVLAATLGLAAVAKVAVEDPCRTTRVLSLHRPARTFVATGLVATIVLLSCGATVRVLDRRIEHEAERISAATAGSCFGAAAMEPRNECADPFGFEGAMDPVFAKTDTSLVADVRGGWECETPRGSDEVRTCVLGSSTQPVRTLAMLGDSHSMHFRKAMQDLADKNNWRVVTYFKSACSGTGAADVVLPVRPDDQEPCADWGKAALREIADSPDIDTVVFSNVSSAYFQDDGDAPIGASRYEDAWGVLTAAGKKVLVIADVPRTLGVDVPDCLAAAGANEAACDFPVEAATPPDATVDAAMAADSDDVSLLDLRDRFCVDGMCHAMIGGVVVYSDSSHLTDTFASTLAPYLELALLGRDVPPVADLVAPDES